MCTTALGIFGAVIFQGDQPLCAPHARRNCGDLVLLLVDCGERERVRPAQGGLLDVLGDRRSVMRVRVICDKSTRRKYRALYSPLLWASC